ncbi:MAG: hypothetical protein ACRC9T_06445 [Vibrionaceae bacterium]
MAGPSGSTSSTTTSAFVALKSRLEQARQLKESVLNIQGVANSAQTLETNADWQQAQTHLVQVQRALDGTAALSEQEYDQIFNEFLVVAALGNVNDSAPQGDTLAGAAAEDAGAASRGAAASASSINDFSALQNSCPEEMLLCAGARLGVPVEFDTAAYAPNSDAQLDLFEAIFMQGVGEAQYCIKGQTARDIAAFFNTLDKNSVYVVRSGTQGGAGHYSALYNENGIWYAHDSRNLAVTPLTDFSQSVTQQALDRFMVAHGQWGTQYGNYSITYCALTPEMVQSLAAYVFNERTNLPQ